MSDETKKLRRQIEDKLRKDEEAIKAVYNCLKMLGKM